MKNERLGVDQFSDLATVVYWDPNADDEMTLSINTEVLIIKVPLEGVAHVTTPSNAAYSGRKCSIYAMAKDQNAGVIDVDDIGDGLQRFTASDLDLTLAAGDDVRIEGDGFTIVPVWNSIT